MRTEPSNHQSQKNKLHIPSANSYLLASGESKQHCSEESCCLPVEAMIRYTKGAFQTLLYWWGGINRHLILNSVVYLIFLVALYWAQYHWPFMRVESSTSGLSMLGSLTVFLLVFRMNQSLGSLRYCLFFAVSDVES